MPLPLHARTGVGKLFGVLRPVNHYGYIKASTYRNGTEQTIL